MKILHMADLHLGAKNSKLPKLQQDILKDEMLENVYYLFETIATRFDVVVICGDLFHSSNVTTKIVNSFFSGVKAYGKPVIYIVGNHDERLVLEQAPSNFIMLDSQNSSFEYQNCLFCNGDYSLPLNKDKTNVLLLHGNIENMQDNDYVDINRYLAKGFDYIALGHVHTAKKYKKGDNIFAYSGSLFSNGFDECGEKGYLEVEINETLDRCEFKPLVQRKYEVVKYDISADKSNKDICQGIRNQFASQSISDRDALRVILTGYYDETLNKSLSLVLDDFKGQFYIEIQDESKLKIDVESLKTEKFSFKNEFISLVENSDLNGDIKQKIISLGIEALKGDDLSV